MPGWSTDIIGVFLGAVLGALFGYGFSWWHAQKETKARRDVLFQAMRQELGRYRPEIPRFVRGISNAKDPLVTVTIDHIMAAHVLDASKKHDAELLYWLIAITSRVAQLNEIARLNNQAFFLTGGLMVDSVSLSLRENWHSTYQTIYSVFIEQRDKVLALLPPESKVEYSDFAPPSE